MASNGVMVHLGTARRFRIAPIPQELLLPYLLRDDEHFPFLYVLGREPKLQTINESHWSISIRIRN
jgi:hypothetical protein